MPDTSVPDDSRDASGDFPWFRRRDQILWASCVTILLAIIAWDVVASRLLRPPLIDIDKAGPIRYRFSIDINKADWTELSVLPGISETYARRIVRFRDENGPFSSIEELTQVSGIGPKRLNAVREYLMIESTGPLVE